MEIDLETARRAVHYLFLLATLAILVTGFGITEYRTVTALTGGLLNKTASFELHSLLTWPFVILLVLHIYLVLTIRRARETGKKK